MNTTNRKQGEAAEGELNSSGKKRNKKYINPWDESEEVTKDILKGLSVEMKNKKLFVPEWTERGGRNPAILLDYRDHCSLEDYIAKAKVLRFSESKMEWTTIRNKRHQKLKYSIPVAVKKLDDHISQKYNGRVTGFKHGYPSKAHQTEYALHVDKDNSLGLFEDFSCFDKLDDDSLNQ